VLSGWEGHTPPEIQNELLPEIRTFLPPGQVVLVADSEFCSIDLLQQIDEWKWQFIVRVRSNIGIEISDNVLSDSLCLWLSHFASIHVGSRAVI
jgi:hypothetical protein